LLNSSESSELWSKKAFEVASSLFGDFKDAKKVGDALRNVCMKVGIWDNNEGVIKDNYTKFKNDKRNERSISILVDDLYEKYKVY